MTGAPPLRVLVAGLVAFVVVVAGVVTLAVASPAVSAQLASHAGAIATGAVASLPAFAAWLTGRQVRATQADHAQKLDRITAQTNGVLDQRIRDGALAALSAAGLTVASTGDLPAVTPDVIPAQPTGR